MPPSNKDRNTPSSILGSHGPAPSLPPGRKGEALGPESFYFSGSSTGQTLSLPVGSPSSSSSCQPWGFTWAQESQCDPACSLWTVLCAPVCSCSGHMLYSTVCSSESKFPIFVSTRLLPLPLSLFTLSYFVAPQTPVEWRVCGRNQTRKPESRVALMKPVAEENPDSRVR